MFLFQNDLVVKLSDNNENAADTDSRILDAYINQCTAEAQEGRKQAWTVNINRRNIS